MKKIKYDLEKADVTLYENIFTKKESESFFKILKNNANWVHGKNNFGLEPRLTAWYSENGQTYTYSGITKQANPWTSELLDIKKRIENEVNQKFNSCLLNYYRDKKDSISEHQDNEKELGKNPIIASVSFGDTRKFRLRPLPKKPRVFTDINLTNGSLLLMKGSTQHFWSHEIPKSTIDVGPRINLTFRIIKEVAT